MKSLVILGSTGSIGQQTLDVAAALPERFEVLGLAAGRQIDLLLDQVRRFRPRYVAAADEAALAARADALRTCGARVISARELSTLPEADVVVAATVGHAGLEPIVAALAAGKDVALANKEAIVAAGPLLARVARRTGARLLPVDSEPSAIWQCLQGEVGTPDEPHLATLVGLAPSGRAVARLILTASGGAFRDWPQGHLSRVRPADALRHPTWRMGPKITVDAATMMNKGLEIIEAHWLFGVPYERIEVLLHRESIVHSLVAFVDGSMKAQCSLPDMRLPIQYALTFPERVARPSVAHLDLAAVGALSFGHVPPERYPCLSLAREAGQHGGTYPAALSGANEEAVACFMAGQVAFTDVAPLVAAALDRHAPVWEPEIDDIRQADELARAVVRERAAAAAQPVSAVRAGAERSDAGAAGSA
ncbi:MAG: 1-deoxy-D-xylulose-5-phosphate reductoisomerase [Chloroflexi bacterium]|nr:1-deoxy-D-xylulose-5-phosphate reductoisomerase [Chloroflexota bacterium]